MDLFKSVFKSVFSRRDVKIFLSFTLLPILVPVLSEFTEGANPEITKNFLSFLDAAVNTQFRFVLPVLLFSLVISSVFKDEIDSGIMFLYKDIKRSKIFNAKLLSLLSVYSIFLIGTVVISLISYYGMMLPRGNVSANFISPKNTEAIYALFSLLTTIGLNLITTVLVVMVSIKSKPIQSVLSGVFFSLFASTAPMWIGIKYLFPNGYAKLSQTNFMFAFTVAAAISVIYFVVFYIKGKRKFDSVEF
ncbi:amino acid transporter [Streptococcus pluranimalium]|uniref:amino acid transporter n=1 Tax=Streptococcus pluranimalium TaxID=82348 RepID=UPI003F68CC8F